MIAAATKAYTWLGATVRLMPIMTDVSMPGTSAEIGSTRTPAAALNESKLEPMPDEELMP